MPSRPRSRRFPRLSAPTSSWAFSLAGECVEQEAGEKPDGELGNGDLGYSSTPVEVVGFR
jgi:hypothetical protein